MAGVERQHGGRRGTRWGADTPSSDEEARERLLDAADACYARRGVARTRIDHIAQVAGVHRTTVYCYFPTKNALVSASFVRSARSILTASKAYFCTDEPFLEQLVKATMDSLRATRTSPTMGLLLGASESAGLTVHAATASEEWHTLARETLGPALTQAVADGHVRADAPVEAILRWIWRVAFSLATEPGAPEDGGDEGVLRTFLVTSVAAPPPESPRRAVATVTTSRRNRR
ncbi:TetR/AcrR family transcriptional regulator [Mycolicibacter kumamotonensis]|uniref:TetR/AcrR family transcriptional regulator n=1 Tax=Mycolicibacter kumamotonensis TaxID=354243 RepID=A0A7K3LGA4_9MYCO|nr:TetR/AcrR family transcriptional regulator [Mycolicibacter kumamotonensis]NDJ91363.1 TetR/AcrR family transcriptional regulator [Mycolicibacter kumamotonensis]